MIWRRLPVIKRTGRWRRKERKTSNNKVQRYYAEQLVKAWLMLNHSILQMLLIPKNQDLSVHKSGGCTLPRCGPQKSGAKRMERWSLWQTLQAPVIWAYIFLLRAQMVLVATLIVLDNRLSYPLLIFPPFIHNSLVLRPGQKKNNETVWIKLSVT